MTKGFPTPRILVEVRQGTSKPSWRPVEILCRYKTVQAAVHALPALANRYRIDVADIRVKHLLTDEAIYKAKLAIDAAKRAP